MAQDNLADISLILDRSSSMHPLAEATIKGINAFIEEQRKVPGNAFLSIYTFATDLKVDLEYENIQTAKAPPYHPSGMTAFFDAVGVVVGKIGTRLSNTPEHLRPGKVIVAIMTDGEENASKRFSGDEIKTMIKHQQEKYAWEFIFLGANIDVAAVSAGIGIRADRAMQYSASLDGVASAYSGASGVTRGIRGSK